MCGQSFALFFFLNLIYFSNARKKQFGDLVEFQNVMKVVHACRFCVLFIISFLFLSKGSKNTRFLFKSTSCILKQKQFADKQNIHCEEKTPNHFVHLYKAYSNGNTCIVSINVRIMPGLLFWVSYRYIYVEYMSVCVVSPSVYTPKDCLCFQILQNHMKHFL